MFARGNSRRGIAIITYLFYTMRTRDASPNEAEQARLRQKMAEQAQGRISRFSVMTAGMRMSCVSRGRYALSSRSGQRHRMLPCGDVAR